MNGYELAEHAGATYRQIDYWTRTGLIKARVNSPGSGINRDYTPEEVAIAVAITRLVDFGFRPPRAAEIARHISISGVVKFGEYLLARVAT